MVAPEAGHPILSKPGQTVTLVGRHSPHPVFESHTETPLCGLRPRPPHPAFEVRPGHDQGIMCQKQWGPSGAFLGGGGGCLQM